MQFNFGRKVYSPSLGFPDVPLLTYQPPTDENSKRVYRKFSCNVAAAALLTQPFITVVDSTDDVDATVKHIVVINHSEKVLKTSQSGFAFETEGYELSKSRTFYNKEMFEMLTASDMFRDNNRTFRLIPLDPGAYTKEYAVFPAGTRLFELEVFIPTVEDTLSPAQKELANVKVTV